MTRWVLLFSCLILHSHAQLKEHFRKVEGKKEGIQVRNIDFIYMINLDNRPEKFERCCGQLEPYGIRPHRFSAVYGWTLPDSVLNDVGIRISKGMQFCPTKENRVIRFPHSKHKLDKSYYGKKIVSQWMSKGAIGCFLSHLSILQDAYDAGYETIWVMEDDIKAERDPHTISDYIDKLDQLVGKGEWDLLYTEAGCFEGGTPEQNGNIAYHYPWFWRPDMPSQDTSYITRCTDVGEEFIKLGNKGRTHSMIIRRSGMKKILDFEKSHGMFLPIDIELSFVPDIRLYGLKTTIIHFNSSISDTENKHF